MPWSSSAGKVPGKVRARSLKPDGSESPSRLKIWKFFSVFYGESSEESWHWSGGECDTLYKGESRLTFWQSARFEPWGEFSFSKKESVLRSDLWRRPLRDSERERELVEREREREREREIQRKYVDGDLDESTKRSASDRLGDLVPHSRQVRAGTSPGVFHDMALSLGLCLELSFKYEVTSTHERSFLASVTRYMHWAGKPKLQEGRLTRGS